MQIAFTLNGAAQQVDRRPGESLLDVLRERCGIVSLKDGCQPQGQCGCCLALVDGQPKVTCAIPAEKAAGRTIVTLEGLSARRARPRRDARLPPPAPCSAASASPASRCGPMHLLDRHPDADPRGDRARHRRPPLPLHRAT